MIDLEFRSQVTPLENWPLTIARDVGDSVLRHSRTQLWWVGAACVSMFYQTNGLPTRARSPLEGLTLEPCLGKRRKDGLKLCGNGSPAILAAENATGVGMDFVGPPVLVVGLRV